MRRTGVLALPLLGMLLAGAVAAAPARVPDPALDEALRDLAALSRTGVLYDRVVPLARLGELDGGPATPVVDRARWRQAWDELRRAAIAVPTGPELAALDDVARASVRAGVLPIALLDRFYERIRPGALEDGSLREEAGRLRFSGGAAATPLQRARGCRGRARPAHVSRR